MSEDRFVADFVSIETAALQLDVSENTLRQWIKKGLARASRRGGGFVLRSAEIDRLRKAGLKESSPAEAGTSPDHEDGASVEVKLDRPKVLPPRPRDEEQKEDRRKKLGRRGSDFSLESLHSEVRIAVEEALDSLDPRFLSWQRRIEDLIHQQRESLETLSANFGSVEHVPSVDQKSQEVLERRSRELEAELEQSRHTSSETRRQLSALQDSQSEHKRQISELEKKLDESHHQLELARTRNEELELERASFQERLRANETEMVRLKQQLEDQKKAGQSESVELQQLQSRLDRLSEELVGERTRADGLQRDSDNLENENLTLRAKIVDLESDKSVIHRSRVDEIERLAQEKQAGLDQISRLQGEVDRLNDEYEKIRHQESSASKKLAEESQARGDLAAQNAALEAKNSELQKLADEQQTEARKLKDQVNNLQFKMQMQVPSGSLSATEDNRKLLEKIADMEVAMREKDRIVSQGYGQLSESRSKLEEMERALYELQQRYDREKEEWSQIVAQQLRNATEQQQRQVPKSAPPPSSSSSSKWGLFRPRGDGLG